MKLESTGINLEFYGTEEPVRLLTNSCTLFIPILLGPPGVSYILKHFTNSRLAFALNMVIPAISGFTYMSFLYFIFLLLVELKLSENLAGMNIRGLVELITVKAGTFDKEIKDDRFNS